MLAAGGCGSDARRSTPPAPRLPAALATDLASRSDRVARFLDANDGCRALAAAEGLQRQTIAAVNAGRVPPRLQETLSAAANDLVFRIQCVPPAPPPPPAAAPGGGEEQPRGHGKGHGKEKHGKGHGNGHGKGKHRKGNED
jgi:hypothetical protein